MRGPYQITRPLNLDQVLAVDVPGFDSNYNHLRQTLAQFINNREYRGTSVENQVIPAAIALQSWLALFKGSMRGNRLEGATKARVCFAERGMVYLMLLINAVSDQLDILDDEEDQTEQVEKFRNELKQFIRTVLGCPARLDIHDKPQGLTLLRNWFSTLVDIVPLDLRSPHTPLTIRNVTDTLNRFCFSE